MDNHTFAYHKVSDGVDFFGSNFYGDKQIKAIPDPEGGNTKKPPTSIPSPFAVIDLVATAFARLAESDDLRGQHIYEKIVSQCWDVAMLFFNATGFGSNMSILHWERKEELSTLMNSNLEGHRILGDTLNMYLKDDAAAYNFDECDSIYILKYNHNYLGGTSPKTLFYCSLNPLEDDPDNYINLGGDDILFDDKYCPLYERPEAFQLYLYRLIKNLDQNAALYDKEPFSVRCKEVYDYLEKNKTILKEKNRVLFEEIAAVRVDDYKIYNPLSTGKEGSYVKVLGLPIGCQPIKTDGLSDFKINSQKYNGRSPLVLFPGFGGQSLYGDTMTYFDNKYTKEIDDSIPFFSSEADISQRELPGMTGIKYPYYLVDDLLEDTLFKVQNNVNTKEFYDCNFDGEENRGFLCPIKKEFFKYFDTDDLLTKVMDDGKPFFELEQRASESILATLRIPVGKGYISLSKTYLEHGRIDSSKNIGNIEYLNIDLNIFPFIKYDPVEELGSKESEKNEFRTNLILNGLEELPSFNYYKNNAELLNKRESKLKGDISFYGFKVNITDAYYDYLEIVYKNTSCVIIPKWVKRNSPSNSFKFAIDFGTTNTHIEYRKNDQEAKPFTLATNVFGRFSKDDKQFYNLSIKEFLPEYIKTDSNYRFHQRSVIAASKSLDYRQPAIALADLRIPFDFDSDAQSDTSDYHTNLKWRNYVHHIEEVTKIRAFLEQLVLMMKAKVLSEDGKIKETKFTWFFPSSMIRSRISKLEKLWMELLQKHFYISSDNVSKISESIAPFAYYMERERVDSLLYPAVTVDIGGGTSDVVIFKNDRPVHLSSFRYAANSIFGDGYNSNPDQNGFVKKYYNQITDLLEANSLTTTLHALNSIKNNTSDSADIVAFLMSLESNSAIRNKYNNISFQQMIANDEQLKTVILLFYHSLIFHIAHYLKHVGQDIPGIMVFSGNGGNIIKLIDDSVGFSLLSEYTTLIYQEVFETELNRVVEIKLNKNPKAVTCKGGLYITKELNVDHTKITKVLAGGRTEPLNLPTYPQLESDQRQIMDDVVISVKECIDLFFELNRKFNYNNNFSINAGTLNLSKKALLTEGIVKKWLLQGFNRKLKELQDNVNVEIEETLFFYPFVGMLNELAHRIYIGK